MVYVLFIVDFEGCTQPFGFQDAAGCKHKTNVLWWNVANVLQAGCTENTVHYTVAYLIMTFEVRDTFFAFFYTRAMQRSVFITRTLCKRHSNKCNFLSFVYNVHVGGIRLSGLLPPTGILFIPM
jgi:hypothetical protein